MASSIPGLDHRRRAGGTARSSRHAVTAISALTITPQAKMVAVANVAAPKSVSRAVALVARLLPTANGPEGKTMKKGRESESYWAPSIVTKLTDRAAAANNEI